jgi:hypothetical protein
MSAASNRRMRDPRFNWLDAPRGELKFAASQQNAAARQRFSRSNVQRQYWFLNQFLVVTGVIAFERTSARPVSDSELYSKMPLTTRAHAASGREVGNFADEDCAANRLWPLPRNEMVGEKL